MKFYNYSRKRRQLKFLAKQLRRLFTTNGGVLTQQAERLLAKMKKILGRKKPIISSIDFRKALGAAAVLFGLGMSTPATAQNFALPEVKPFGMDTIRDYAFPAFADLDADGDLDLFAGRYADDYMGMYNFSDFLYFENTGTLGSPVFGTSPISNPFGTVVDVDNYFNPPTFADLDGDGDQDLMTGAQYGQFYYYENVGTATAPEFDDPQVNPFGLDSVYYFSFPDLVDLDGDGDFDLLSGESYYNYDTGENLGNFVFFENIGTTDAPSFAAPVVNPFGLSSIKDLTLPTAGDLDDDGDLDILAGQYYNTFVYFENTGSATAPQFAAPVDDPFGIVTYQLSGISVPQLSDLDNDGDIDLFVVDEYGVALFYENTVKNPVSIKEVAPAFELEVFPNPVHDKLVIQTKEEIQQVEVIDLLGRTIKVFQATQKSIGLEDLHAGVYTLRVMDRKGDFVLKKIQKL